jgi:hypothetical protein
MPKKMSDHEIENRIINIERHLSELVYLAMCQGWSFKHLPELPSHAEKDE